MSSSWNVQANGKKARAGNRSDAIMLSESSVIHYARPNLFWGHDEFAGPADIWNPKKGFLVQSINPESYSLNFPTTGLDGLYFDLLITGDIEELTWEPVTHEGITATVTNVVANDVWIPSGNVGQVVARVKLTGPEARNQWDNPNPSPIAKPQLPQTFELVGRDIYGGEVVKYGFVLKQWFVNRGSQFKTYSDQLAWCNSLGYRMPRVRDLTNAVCSGWGSGSHCQGAVGATPSSSGNHYKRHIGAGFFAEWGPVHSYTDAGFVPYFYWTSDATGIFQFNVYSFHGYVDGNGIASLYGLCTAP
ncbi:hypothetical protein [Gilliamella sp. Gris3-2]|uniref:hypothetical protein n=1 Tax=Gilliamella sp. Gris3-2 TaxID=3120245 RepID=UPI00080DFC24|nr:hypothetical protein [Gilliamella apicola]OCG36257.1 hypothetical protein A9G32_05235 [Gilliamella apicola]OCG48546.1 hypothetical protein A9G27_04350 [Gilliamella apicola]OCG52762.1 hypothetical protein A9G26_01765 [Gilliamella apicola]